MGCADYVTEVGKPTWADVNKMGIPETPAEPGPFGAQHGYLDISFKTHTYSDKPTPFAAKQGRALEFVSTHTDREHQKKYGKQVFSFLVNFICK